MGHAAEKAFGERRLKERVGLNSVIRFNYDGFVHTGFGCNISTGGIFVATYTVVRGGTQLDIVLALPDGGEPMQIQVEVLWSRPYEPRTNALPGFALRFCGLGESCRERIERFIRRHRSDAVDEIA